MLIVEELSKIIDVVALIIISVFICFCIYLSQVHLIASIEAGVEVDISTAALI
jgi:hypothetical protein